MRLSPLVRLLRSKDEAKAFASFIRHCRGYSSESMSKNILASPYSDVVLPNTTIHSLIWESVPRWADKTALECGVTGRSYTYAQLQTYSERFGASLLKSGLTQKDVVALYLPNCPEYVVAFFGCSNAGIPISTLNPVYTVDEVIHQFKDSSTSCIVTNSALYPIIQKVLEKMKKNLPVICIECDGLQTPPNVTPYSQFIKDGIETSLLSSVKYDLNAARFLPYSSGTTGLAKGVCLTHRCLSANMAQCNHPKVNPILDATASSQDTVPAILPFFHIYGLVVVLLRALMHGSKVVSLPKFEPNSFINSIKKNKEVILHVAPPLIFFLGNNPAVTSKDLQSLKFTMSGAAPCSAADIEKVMTKKRHPILQGYGMTETSPVLTCSPIDSTNISTIGLVICNTLAKVIDINTKEPLPEGKEGELLFKGPQIMNGYLNNPKATADTIDEDGWIHTGDIGYYDENKEFYLVDRIKELIKVKGFQVAPAELEAVTRQHPAVCTAGVVGVQCEQGWEVPVAMVAIKDPSIKVKPEDIQNFVAEKVAPYKKLHRVFIVDNVPKSASGKILRRQIKEDLKKLM